MRRGILRICALLGALALAVGAAAAEDEVDLLAVDHRLYELGYRDGACSGVLDEVMVNALKNFQEANGLGITGVPDAGTVLVLNSDTALSQADYLTQLSQQIAAMPLLKAGDGGEDVVQMQRSLKELGYLDGAVNGEFDASTAEAVNRFQLANGLPLTGEAGGATLARLYGDGAIAWGEFLHKSTAKAGESGAAVRTLQHWLRCRGYFEGECTGRYGEETQRAVRQFQTEVGLEASGDASIDTCRALFKDVTALAAEVAALHPGEAGAEELCQGLSALGYAAHEIFDMQTELALMQFQSANALAPTGAADAATMERLRAADAVGRAGFVAAGAEAAQSEEFPAQVARQAARLLGQMAGFDEEFGLVQYAYLKRGVAVTSLAQFAEAGTALTDAQPGDVMQVQIGDLELCGLTGYDGALIYRDGSGRIVMGYPATMGATAVRLYRLAAQ